MLRRSPFKPKAPPPSRARVKQWEGPMPTPRKTAVAMLVAPRRIVAAPKENALQHLGYMAAARLLTCRRCGWFRRGFMQFAHADEGKGTGLKTDCRLGWTACGPHDDLPGCHWFVGTSGRMSKEGRREFERFAGASTRAEMLARDWWPKRLPRWEEA